MVQILVSLNVAVTALLVAVDLKRPAHELFKGRHPLRIALTL
jgi:hypothetical protein